jgi:hypothetical protein
MKPSVLLGAIQLIRVNFSGHFQPPLIIKTVMHHEFFMTTVSKTEMINIRNIIKV